MSVIGEAALSALFQGLFEKMASSDLLKYVSEKEVHAEIKKWERMLLKIHDVLDDAEEKQMANRSVKRWLGDLHDLAYEVEDMLDEFTTESLQRKLKGERQASTSKVRKLIPSCCTSFTPSAVMFNSKMASKIEKITARLQDLTSQKDTLELRVNVVGISNNAWQRPPTTCLHDEPQVYGRDEDKRKILDLLTREDTTDAKVGVLPIVGMGGLGKTTLARHIFTDESLQQNFHPKAWVCVSEDFDIMRITKAILESITKRPSDLKELNQVQLELHKELAGKKFLLVLDDVWSERYEDWNALRPPFMDGAPGCRIIVTTRSRVVAEKMGTIKFHTLERICDDDCWFLFSRHAFENRSVGTHPNEEIIHGKVISKCAGLPLAARTLGGLLRSKPRDKWEDILNCKTWSFDDSDILPVLRLSYHHLPSHLKRCFSFCAIFPKDYEFTEMEVVLLWMAEGLIQQMDDIKPMEDRGSEYFRDLLSRSLFQAASNDGSKFVMHDLVNDLAQRVAGETCFRLEDEATASGQFIRERVRHSSYSIHYCDGVKKMEAFYKMPSLRTLLPLSPSEITESNFYLTNDVLFNLLPKLRLRVLSLKGYEIFEIPDSIGDLKHLRYLDLSLTKIRSLPESTIQLCNLQTLILRGCRNLRKLPSRIEDWINLRHLDIEESGLKEVGLGVKELTSLRTLSQFSVGKDAEGRLTAGLTALKNLKFLRGKLGISQLENVTDVLHGREASLKEKEDLRVLLLEWGLDWYLDNTRGKRSDGELLDGLQPHVGLRELHILNSRVESFPFWVGDPSFFNLVVIRLKECGNCTSLPKFGLLPSLRELYIEGMSSLRTVGDEFCGEGCSDPFPALEILHFKNMYTWKHWNPCGLEFPSLKELTLLICPKLEGKLPRCLSKLRKLKIRDCRKLVIPLPSLPVVSELKIEECKEVDFRNMDKFGSPNSMELIDISKFTFETEGLIERLIKSKSVSIRGDPGFSCSRAVAEEKERKLRVEELELDHCESLLHWAHNFISLRRLTLQRCPNLVSFEDVSFPSTLRVIRIHDCEALASLPTAANCLEELEILLCNSLISIGRSQLSSTLKRLVINYCENLQSLLLDSSPVINLEFISVEDCPSLTSLSSSGGHLPCSLKHLRVTFCSKLETIAESFNNLNNLEFLAVEDCPSLKFLSSARVHLPCSLKQLRLFRCSRLESIAESFNNTLSLQLIQIVYCDKLRYLPKDLHKLVKLHEITIIGCRNLVFFPQEGLPTTCLKVLQLLSSDRLENVSDNVTSVQQTGSRSKTSGIVFFPEEEIEEGFPIDPTTLMVSNVMICKPLFEWGLHKLTTLTMLSIDGGCSDIVSFPCDNIGMMLPPSLVQLTIENFTKLQCLSANGFQELTSLEELRLCNCPVLTAFPKNGLPLSLLKLYINKCPLLKQRCQDDKGKEWFKIAHIPRVQIDDRNVFVPDWWYSMEAFEE